MAPISASDGVVRGEDTKRNFKHANASAIGLLERALTKCRDTLGASHPQTFGAAYQLVVALLRAGEDSDRLRELIGRDLAPLADADPASLSAELRGIRLRLTPLIQSLQMPD